MLSHRIARGPCLRAVAGMGARPAVTVQRRFLSKKEIEALDPDMNGGYVNPPRISRQFRDPHGDWWDKQERRNFGEPVHEDNDILGVFAPEEYTFYTPRQAFFMQGCFASAVLALCGVVYLFYPDRPTVPREFEGGLEREMGGPNTLQLPRIKGT